MIWDVFISHASEDKDEVARPLVKALEAKGIRVWYDEITLQIGHSLLESIDKGLRESRYVVVIVSQRFFQKDWTKRELEGAFSRNSPDDQRVLPVWHNVTAKEVGEFFLILKGRVAAETSSGVPEVAERISKRVCQFRVSDHHGRVHEVDVSECVLRGQPIVPPWLASDPARMCSEWLVTRLPAGAELRVYEAKRWADGTWFVVDAWEEDGVVINLSQRDELLPTTATTQPPWNQ